MDPVECYDDPDRNGVFKVTPELNQNFVITVGNKETGKKTKTVYELDLAFEPADENDNIGA